MKKNEGKVFGFVDNRAKNIEGDTDFEDNLADYYGSDSCPSSTENMALFIKINTDDNLKSKSESKPN